jgi:hypothetical protein
MLPLLRFAVCTYLIQLIALVVQALHVGTTAPSQDAFIGLLSSALVFGLQAVSLAGSDKLVWYPYIGSVCIALLTEPIIGTLTMLARTPGSLPYVQVIDTMIVAARYVAFVLVMITYHSQSCNSGWDNSSECERQCLLPKTGCCPRLSFLPGAPGSGTTDYGSASGDSNADAHGADCPEHQQQQSGRAKKQTEQSLAVKVNWLTYAGSCMVSLEPPYAVGPVF